MKKVTGNNADEHYTVLDTETGEVTKLEPEFNSMSLKPGIGATWFEKYAPEVFPRDVVVANGVKCKPPRYYGKQLEKYLDGFDGRADNFAKEIQIELEQARFRKFKAAEPDATPARLKVREVCTKARITQLKRGLI